MKKKGFTLIELLAVIVVLAIIAIISVPIITSVIDKAKLGALKDSAYGIIDASELYLAKNMSTGITDTIEFTCSNGECLSGEERIDYKGNIKTGTLILTPSSKSLICIDNGKDYVLKLADDEKVSTGKGTCGEYEESNGTFNIVEATSARIEELESELNLIKNFLNTSNISFQFIYKGTNDEFEVPISGLYKIELWGSGGGNASTILGGKGGYVSGKINLTKSEKIYVYVGGRGISNSQNIVDGGYNGGGSSGIYYAATTAYIVGSGGGSTDVRIDGITINDRIMVAGSGGGSIKEFSSSGGSGGGLDGYSTPAGYSVTTGATQTIGGIVSNSRNGSFYFGGVGSNTGGGGGAGGGYYGGATGFANGGSGGSSYISGHTGCVGITSESDTTPKSGCTTGTTDNNCSLHYSGYKFTDTIMIDGKGYNWTNEKGELTNMPTHDGTSTMIGNTGDGFAKITLISID